MKSTLWLKDKEALDAIKRGVDLIFEPVRRTLGPEARTTLMFRTYNRGPRFVDDGHYTAEAMIPSDPFEKLASEAYKEAIMRTNRKVGDGTSSTNQVAGTLFREIYNRLYAKNQGYSSVKSNPNSGMMAMKREILAEAAKVCELVRKASKPIKNLADMEKISAISLGEESELSKKIAELCFNAGPDGFIDVVEGYKNEVEVEAVEGVRFYAKTCAKVFVNKPERYEMVVDDCPVLITNHRFDNDVLARYVVQKVGGTKLIVIAPDFSDAVLVNMVLAQKNGTFIWPVKAPSLRTEQMEDLACYFDARLIDKNSGGKLQMVVESDLGLVERLIVKDAETREDAIALGGRGAKGDAVKKRIETLRGQLAETREPQFQKLMERRIASLASAGGVIRVGSPTDAESLPLKLKVEDVVYACRAALKGGYVKGGGLCLKEIAEELPEGHILKVALTSPYQQIQENAGGTLAIGKDVIDPADAVYYTVEYACSVVSSLITVGNIIAEEPEIQQGQGEKDIARAIQGYTYAFKKERGILTENEKLMANDMRGGLTDDEATLLNDN